MLNRFLEVLPHLINGTAPFKCVVFFWTIIIVIVYLIFRKRRKD